VKRTQVFIVLLALMGCGDTSDTDACATFYIDNDSDGWGTAETTLESCQDSVPGYVRNDQDCDDTHTGVQPNASEVCDLIDNNCDGFADEGLGTSTFYADTDGDGAGDPMVPIQACMQPPDASLTNDDCDDTTAAAWPGAVEICDGIDNDCDADIDDDDPSLEVAAADRWYPDVDNDGYGDMLASGNGACLQPAGAVADNTDCDDADPDIHPGALELCDALGSDTGFWGPGIDENCNGLIDDADPALDPSSSATWYLDSDSDDLGDPNTSVVACSPGSNYVLNPDDCDDGNINIGSSISWYLDGDGDGYGTGAAVIDCNSPGTTYVSSPLLDCDDSDGAINPLAIEVCGDTLDQNCSGGDKPCGTPFDGLDTVARSLVHLDGITSHDLAGTQLVIDDFNVDGVDDLVVGAPGAGGGGYYGGDGATYQLNGTVLASDDLATADVIQTGGSVGYLGDHYGASLASGELDGDGIADLLVGAPFEGLSAGRVLVHKGPLTVSGAASTLANASFYGTGIYLFAGYGTAAGDLNGDLLDDVVVGGYGWLSLHAGPATGTTPVTTNLAMFTGGVELGQRIDVEHDFNGDGSNDVIASAFNDDEVYTFLSPFSGVLTTASADLTLLGAVSSANFGMCVASGDLDGDGTADVLAGAPEEDVIWQGGGTLRGFDGNLLGTIAAATADLTVLGDVVNRNLGVTCETSDLNADGKTDLLISSGNGNSASEVFVFYGPLSGILDAAQADSIISGLPGDNDGYTMAVGDLNDDGILDVALGNPNRAGLSYQAGGASVLLGLP
jgi:hypothetical protein